MRLVMYAIGSRGDVLPCLALGRELQRRGHSVSLCAFTDFQNIIEEAGLLYSPLRGDSKQYISELISGPTGVKFLHRIDRALPGLAESFLRDVENAAHDADAMISNYFGDLFQNVAEYLHLPFIQAQFFPMNYTADFPVTAAPFRHLGRLWNRFSYHVAYGLITAIEKRYLDSWRKERGMLPIRMQTKWNNQINGHIIPVIYAFPQAVLPRPAEWGDHIYMTGFWHEIENFSPDKELQEFLEKGSPPVYIGFGSVAQRESNHLIELAYEALRQTGVRAVVNIGDSDIDFPKDPRIYTLRYVSHDWLFPKVSAVVHHGGAGTTAAALQAGKPMLIIPFGADQAFWAERAETLKLGPKSIEAKKITAQKLADRLRELTTHREYSENALHMADLLRDTHPTADAADIIERELNDWLHCTERKKP